MQTCQSKVQRERETGGGGGGGDCGQKNSASDSERLVTESHKMVSVFIQPGYKTKAKCFSFLHVSVRKFGSW